MLSLFRGAPPQRRRAVVAVQVGVFAMVLVGFAALTIDVGAMYNAKADLQRTADAAALAAAGRLSEYDDECPLELARDAAVEFAYENTVFGRTMRIDPDQDVTFGRANFDVESNSYTFWETNKLPDAVRVTVRMTDQSNGKLTLYFARVFGVEAADMQASALAVMVPRDISVVADLSGSHTDDSELQHMRQTDINLFDVWEALPIVKGRNGVGNGIDAPAAGNPEKPASAPGTGPCEPGGGGVGDPGTDPLGGQTGPTWGWMYYWGNEITEDYVVADDPALMYFPRYNDWSNADLETWYTNVGYSPDEVAALVASTYDGSQDSWGQYGWTNRVAVAMGLARWDSGQPGGLWETIPADERQNGNGNNWPGAAELTWLVDYPFDEGSWHDYIYNYVRKSNTSMAQTDSDFQYRFGLKTFVNYLMERQVNHHETPELADVPCQPMQAVKDAVTYMVDLVSDLQTDDQLSLEIYGTTARHEVDLTHDHYEVSDRLNEMQAGHYDTSTNMGGGIQRAIEELSGERARGLSRKMIFLLTDGVANIDSHGNFTVSGGEAYALSMAQAAADAGIRIFAVSVGSGANLDVMDDIADLTNGDHFHAAGSISNYSAELEQIFHQLGGTRPIELIE